jgi:hypothetical protein
MDSQHRDNDAGDASAKRFRMWSDSSIDPCQQDHIPQQRAELEVSAMQQHAIEREKNEREQSAPTHPPMLKHHQQLHLPHRAPQSHSCSQSAAGGDRAPSQFESVQEPATPTDEELEDIECEHQLTLIKMQRLQSEMHEQASRAKTYELLIESMKRIRDEKRGRRVMKKVNEVIRDARGRINTNTR